MVAWSWVVINLILAVWAELSLSWSWGRVHLFLPVAFCLAVQWNWRRLLIPIFLGALMIDSQLSYHFYWTTFCALVIIFPLRTWWIKNFSTREWLLQALPLAFVIAGQCFPLALSHGFSGGFVFSHLVAVLLMGLMSLFISVVSGLLYLFAADYFAEVAGLPLYASALERLGDKDVS